jgi:hypothetical protein
MKPSAADLRRYAGGHILMRKGKDFFNRGEITRAFIGGDTGHEKIMVSLKWMAEGQGYPPAPVWWTVGDQRLYEVSLSLVFAEIVVNGWLSLYMPDIGESALLYPPGENSFNPASVHGLSLSSV